MRLGLLVVLLGLHACAPAAVRAPAPLRPELVDDPAAAVSFLEAQRAAVSARAGTPSAASIRSLVEVGMFESADQVAAAAGVHTVDLALATAELRLRQHRFAEARELIERVLAQQPANRTGQRLAAWLALETGDIEAAWSGAAWLLERGRRDADAALLIARIHLLRGEVTEAHEWAARALDWRPGSADALVLQGRIRLAAEDSERAAAAREILRKALAADPLHADARYLYGSLLAASHQAEAQARATDHWLVALAADPLHLPTLRRLGPGMAAPPEEALAVATRYRGPFDALLAGGQVDEAVALARKMAAEAGSEALAAHWRGSAWYQAHPARGAVALDSAQAAFEEALRNRPEWGAPRVGLAAVLEQRRLRGTAAVDSLAQALYATPIHHLDLLFEVFPDLFEYPGDRMARLVAGQMGPMAAYLPLLARVGVEIDLRPLHEIVPATVSGAPLRAAPEWHIARWEALHSDGVVQRAALGVEEVERGAYLGRRTLVHELAHLVYQNLLPEPRRSRVRALYLAAAGADRLAPEVARNEWEYLGHLFEVYFSPARQPTIEPWGGSTRTELLRTDPDGFNFIAEVAAELERSLAGDPLALRGERAEMYRRLAWEARRGGHGRPAGLEYAAVLLDSALVHDGAYLPAMVEYAAVEAARSRFDRAEEWLMLAEGVDPAAPIVQIARSDLLAARRASLPATAEMRLHHVQAAVAAESDPIVRAGYEGALRDLYVGQGRIADAILAANEQAIRYESSGATPREAALAEEARSAAVALRLSVGYAEEAIEYFGSRTSAQPHRPALRSHYADALALAGRYDEAEAALEQGRAALRGMGGVEAAFELRLAELQLLRGDSASARALLEPLLATRMPVPDAVDGRLARLLISLGESTETQRQLALLPPAFEPAEQAELAFTRGWILNWRGDGEQAERLYREALGLNPYHLQARITLHRLLREQGRLAEADQLALEGRGLPIPLGPALERALANLSVSVGEPTLLAP